MPALKTSIALAVVGAALWGCAHDVVLGDYVPEPADAASGGSASGGAADGPASGGHDAGDNHFSGGADGAGGWHGTGGWHAAGGWSSMGGMNGQPDDDIDDGGGPIGPGPQDEGGPDQPPIDP